MISDVRCMGVLLLLLLLFFLGGGGGGGGGAVEVPSPSVIVLKWGKFEILVVLAIS